MPGAPGSPGSAAGARGFHPTVDEAHSLLSTAPGTRDTAMSKRESLLPWSLPAAQGWTDSKISKMCHL